jgi:hypothetical protein
MQQEQQHSVGNRAMMTMERSQQGQQITQLTSKLNAQAERVLKWKMHTELEIRKRDEKLKEFESSIQRQHSNMLNQQMHCEKLSQRLQAELVNRGELKLK